MLESKISGVKMAALSTTLPVESKTTAQNQKYYVASELQTTSDLGFDAAERIITRLEIAKEDIGILLFGSKTPDYRSPNTAAIVQGRLGLSIDCICFDTNVGANGFIKMTHIAAALLAHSSTEYALIIIGDTPSKLQNKHAGDDFEISDAATAVLLQKTNAEDVMEFSTYSSGAHFKGQYLKEGGFRDFNENKPFDGSNSDNYIVKSNEYISDAFFEECNPFVEESLKGIRNNRLIHSNIIENLQMEDHWKSQRLINADASELPLLLENAINDEMMGDGNLQCSSAGEGMAFMTMKINHLPKIVPKNHTLDFFQEYRVSHEM
jgi:hypothetical protein